MKTTYCIFKKTIGVKDASYYGNYGTLYDAFKVITKEEAQSLVIPLITTFSSNLDQYVCNYVEYNTYCYAIKIVKYSGIAVAIPDPEFPEKFA